MMRNGTWAGVLALLAALLIGNALAAEPDKEKDDIKTLREDLDNFKKKAALESRLNNAELKVINDRLDRIEAALERLGGKTKTRSSSSFTPRADTGTLVLDNRMTVPASVTIDGITHRVPEGGKLTLNDRPAGTFSYTVTGAGMGLARRRTVLSKGETLTVTITPPAVRVLDE